MRKLSILAAIAAVGLWCGTASAGEKIKLPTASNQAKVTTAVQHGTTPITTVQFGRRAAYRRGYWNGYNTPGYSYSYRPYYNYGYGYPYGSYYSAPYYGYSYYSPGVSAWGPGVRVGVAPWGAMWW